MSILKNNLDRLKEVELEIFKEFKKICNDNHLRYFALGGTALGAVRHNGFIPWDDDIDVGMPREDYEIFLSIADNLLPEYLFLQHIGSEVECPFNMAKIRDSRTTFIENAVKNINMNHGAFIDIFPLDGYKTGGFSEVCFKIQKALLTISVNKKFNMKRNRNFKGKILSLVADFYCRNPHMAILRREKLYKKHKYDACDVVANHNGAWGDRETMSKEIFGEGRIGIFEGIEIMLPKDTDQYLSALYGDYMTLPPAEKQNSHHDTTVLDLDKPYWQYL